MEDLIIWFRAQLDECATDAQAVLDENAAARAEGGASTLWDEEDAAATYALDEINAKRQILALHTPAVLGDPSYGCPTCWQGAEGGGPMGYPCPTLRSLAGAPFAQPYIPHTPGADIDR